MIHLQQERLPAVLSTTAVSCKYVKLVDELRTQITNSTPKPTRIIFFCAQQNQLKGKVLQCKMFKRPSNEAVKLRDNLTLPPVLPRASLAGPGESEPRHVLNPERVAQC